MKVKLGLHDDPVKKALVAQAVQMRRNTVKVLRGPGMEPLHDLRITALRENFALKFFRKFINGNTGTLRDELVRARKVMAKRRDWDIAAPRINKNFQVLNMASFQNQKALKLMRSEKAKARDNLVVMLKSYPYKKMLRDLKQIATARNTRKIDPQILLKDTLKELKRQQESSLHPAVLHKIRITLKNLRYACEFFSDFYDKEKIQSLIADIVDVQDVLGEYQDGENTLRKINCLRMTEKSRGITKLKEIEERHTIKARKDFVKIWKSKKCRRIFGAFP